MAAAIPETVALPAGPDTAVFVKLAATGTAGRADKHPRRQHNIPGVAIVWFPVLIFQPSFGSLFSVAGPHLRARSASSCSASIAARAARRRRILSWSLPQRADWRGLVRGSPDQRQQDALRLFRERAPAGTIV